MQKKSFLYYDWLLLLLYVLLVAFGWINIYAVDYEKDGVLATWFNLSTNPGRQLVWIVGCVLLFIGSLFFDTTFYRSLAYVFYLLSMILLAITLVWGTTVGGHSAWLRLGSFQFQPTEFVKLTCALAIAKRLEKVTARLTHRYTQLAIAGLVLAPVGLILLQGDLGSALVYGSFVIVCYREGFPVMVLMIGAGMVVVFILNLLIPSSYLITGMLSIGFILVGVYSRSRKKIILVSVVMVATIAFTAVTDWIVHKALKPHQQNRIKILVNPNEDPLGIGWNVTQSKIAIGSGGFFGKGFLNGTQTRYGFVPEQGKDFIFCTIGEEYGWLGSILFIITYLSLVLRVIYIAERQRLRFSRVYGYGVASVLFFHFFINVGMTIGLLPVIGIPLPFISYGGSSLWTFSIMLFILLRLDVERNHYVSWKSLAVD